MATRLAHSTPSLESLTAAWERADFDAWLENDDALEHDLDCGRSGVSAWLESLTTSTAAAQ